MNNSTKKLTAKVVVVYLASEHASWVTGETHSGTGGVS